MATHITIEIPEKEKSHFYPRYCLDDMIELLKKHDLEFTEEEKKKIIFVSNSSLLSQFNVVEHGTMECKDDGENMFFDIIISDIVVSNPKTHTYSTLNIMSSMYIGEQLINKGLFVNCTDVKVETIYEKDEKEKDEGKIEKHDEEVGEVVKQNGKKDDDIKKQYVSTIIEGIIFIVFIAPIPFFGLYPNFIPSLILKYFDDVLQLLILVQTFIKELFEKILQSFF
ncbi:MAG: hypothetical protein Edafosvirus36_7 [Edafosvirus sp.]|uniref:Uncharacterized protein n=1 Tax=Edafosvirus sp. TaxID=2487765 RepID=A0A3G4ZV89_9VIRU|nr:MAG: hypothetical protein Edafosvirus36_7 [Edafosvirus sp.]